MRSATVRLFAFALLLASSALLPRALAAQSASANVGQSVTLSVSVTAGTPPFSYQWQKAGVPISGATAQTYTIPAVALADAGTYTCAVSNPAGSTTSDPASLAVTLVIPAGATITITVK